MEVDPLAINGCENDNFKSAKLLSTKKSEKVPIKLIMELPKNKLPTNLDITKYYLFLWYKMSYIAPNGIRKMKDKQKDEIFKQIEHELVIHWESHKIPVICKRSVFRKIKSTINSICLNINNRPVEMNSEKTLLIRKSEITKADILFDISRCKCFASSKSKDEIIFEICKCTPENKIPTEKFELYKESFISKPPKKSKKPKSLKIRTLLKRSIMHDKKLFKCEFCHNSYNQGLLLDEHIRVVHIECNYTMDDEKIQEAPKHITENPNSTKNNNRRKQKLEVINVLTETETINEDLKTIAENYKCRSCNQSFNLKKELSKHHEICEERIKVRRQRQSYDFSMSYDEEAMDSILSEIVDFEDTKERVDKDPDYRHYGRKCLENETEGEKDTSKCHVKIVDEKYDCGQCQKTFCNIINLKGIN